MKLNKTIKRALSGLLTAAMMISMFPAVALPTFAADLGKITGGITLKSGEYTLETSFNGGSIVVPNGVTATVTVPTGKSVTIDNTTAGGSPIAVNDGGSLNLVVNGTLTVKGQNGYGAGNITNARPNSGSGGYGGVAGILVASTARLKLNVNGSVVAYGGNAGAPGSSSGTSDVYGGAGGAGGAGAGIGGSGGLGGDGVYIAAEYIRLGAIGGGKGGDAGQVDLLGTGSVTTYGGGGSYGGNFAAGGGGGGAGGYPAAGLGGGGSGGAGGYWASNNGGYSGAATEGAHAIAVDGKSGGYGPWGGHGTGGYYQAGATNPNPGDANAGVIGGYIGGGTPRKLVAEPEPMANGNGGAGGDVVCDSTLALKAYNGSYLTGSNKTTDPTWSNANAATIYAQLGFSLNDIRAKSVTDTTAYSANPTGMATYLGTTKKIPKNIAPTPVLGIGSGAGFIETSNGTYTTAIQHDIATAPLTVTGANNYYVVGSSNLNNITVNADARGTIILDTVSIDMRNKQGNPAINILPGANVNVQLIGSNKLYDSDGIYATL